MTNLALANVLQWIHHHQQPNNPIIKVILSLLRFHSDFTHPENTFTSLSWFTVLVPVTFKDQNWVCFSMKAVFLFDNLNETLPCCLSGYLRSSEFTWLSSSNNSNRLSVLLAWQVPTKTTRCWWIGVIRNSTELCTDLLLLFTFYFSTAAFKLKDLE